MCKVGSSHSLRCSGEWLFFAVDKGRYGLQEDAGWKAERGMWATQGVGDGVARGKAKARKSTQR